MVDVSCYVLYYIILYIYIYSLTVYLAEIKWFHQFSSIRISLVLNNNWTFVWDRWYAESPTCVALRADRKMTQLKLFQCRSKMFYICYRKSADLIEGRPPRYRPAYHLTIFRATTLLEIFIFSSRSWCH